MRIAAPCVVSLIWTLADAQGEAIDALTEPIEFFYGGDDLLAKVEEAIAGHEAGYAATLHLEPEHAFGEYDPELVFFEERGVLPEEVEPGMQFEGPPPGAKTPDLDPEALYTVTEIYPEHVVLDGNHPLAGIALRLALTVMAVREASDKEVEARSVGSGAVRVLAAVPGSARLH